MAKEDIFYWCDADPSYSPEWHWISQNIALGSYPLDDVMAELRAEGITAIISLREEEPMYDRDTFDASHVVIHSDCVPFPYEKLVSALRFLHAQLEAGRKVYVHCFAGISRSSFLVSCYFMLRDSIPFEEAEARVRAARSKVYPNPGLYDPALLERLRADRDAILSPAPVAA